MSDTTFDFAPGWKPDEGDVIVGRVIELSKGASQWGHYPIIVIRTDDGDRAVHAFHHSLKNRLLDLKPRIGERIGIQYKGKRDSKSHPGQQVAVYIVRIDGRDADNAWAGITPAGEPPRDSGAEATPQQEALYSVDDFTPAPANAVTEDTQDDIPF